MPKWRDDEPPLDGLVHIPKARLVIADDGELELRLKRKEVGAHEARRDRVPAGEFGDPLLCPSAALFRLGSPGHASAMKPGNLSRVTVVLRLCQGLDGDVDAIVAKQVAN